MKNFSTLILSGFLISVLPISAENIQSDGAYMTTIEEELMQLDEEFEDFKEELFSLEERMKSQAKTPSAETVEVPAIAAEPPSEGIAPEISQVPAIAAEPPAEEVAPVAAKVEEEIATQKQSLEAAPQEMGAIATENTLNQEPPSEPVVQVVAPLEYTAETTPVFEDATATVLTALPKEEEKVQEPIALLSVEGSAFVGEQAAMNQPIAVDLKQAFSGSPIIYGLLGTMSVFAVCVWLYALIRLKKTARIPETLLRNIQNKLGSNNFEEALTLCQGQESLFCKMLTSGIYSRRHGLPVMIESMKAEGKRTTVSFWQNIGMLNDIAILAPMLGLLGTVLGMFYAFYDVNRSIESISTLFDGLGISVGTTVAGLIVAILALILQSTAKYRLVRALAHVENEAQSFASLIEDRTSIHNG